MYGHGISNRLTGGPGTTSCLGNQEQMGEGWSDLMTLIIHAAPDDIATDPREIGVWSLGSGYQGIRNFPYTTDIIINPQTYDDSTGASPHALGEIWAAMVWEVCWNLVHAHGFNPNIYDDWTTGGNNLTLQLMMDGMKLQPCSPGFVDGRDAIYALENRFALSTEGVPKSLPKLVDKVYWTKCNILSIIPGILPNGRLLMSVRHAMLALLSEHPKFGLQLQQEFESRTGNVWPLNVGQVYTTLQRLERDGLIVCEEGEIKGSQKDYRLTPAGRNELSDWLQAPTELEPPPRDELVIKVLVALRVPNIDVHEVLQVHRRHLVEMMQRYTHLKAEAAQDDVAFALVVDAQIFRLEGIIRWLNAADVRLKQFLPTSSDSSHIAEAQS